MDIVKRFINPSERKYHGKKMKDYDVVSDYLSDLHIALSIAMSNGSNERKIQEPTEKQFRVFNSINDHPPEIRLCTNSKANTTAQQHERQRRLELQSEVNTKLPEEVIRIVKSFAKKPTKKAGNRRYKY